MNVKTLRRKLSAVNYWQFNVSPKKRAKIQTVSQESESNTALSNIIIFGPQADQPRFSWAITGKLNIARTENDFPADINYLLYEIYQNSADRK